jgi:hypothetical protein
MGTMMLCFALGGIAALAWSMNFFGTMLVVETLVAIVAYYVLRFRVNQTKWNSID